MVSAREKEKRKRKALNAEMTHLIIDADEAYHQNIFQSEERYIEVKKFVETSEFYKQNRWRGIPVEALDEKALYEPFTQLLDHIFKHFGYPTRNRVLLDTHDFKLCHKDGSTTAPSFMAMGLGPNFSATDDGENVTSMVSCYRRCASPGYIKAEKDKLKSLNTTQVAIFARQCFIEQPNRRFVYAVLLTEATMRLFIFDRSGILRSKFFNIHEHPEDFVRIILGFCSPEDEEIGFDTSIFWEKEGVNEGGKDTKHETESMEKGERDPKENQKEIENCYDQFICLDNHWDRFSLGKRTYRVQNTIYARDALRGRGTRCWTVFDPEDDTKILVIKDSWRNCNREPEAKLLADVVGLAGVGQMVAYQDDGTDRISSFRWVANCDLKASQEHDRIFNRIALEKYGKPLECFKDRLHLLCAFRDAVKGHQNLWAEKHILHRDVSLNNILYGKEGAPDGFKGILIDLDCAIRIDGTASLMDTTRTGTRLFQSVNVLLNERYGSPRDYLDDLESFFYCLAMICCTFTGPGKAQKIPKNLELWNDPDASNAANAKKVFFLEGEYMLTPYFRKYLAQMFRSMGEFLSEHARKKGRASRERLQRAEPIQVDFQTLMDQSKDHYDVFIGFIDEAIERLLSNSDFASPQPDALTQQYIERLRLLYPTSSSE